MTIGLVFALLTSAFQVLPGGQAAKQGREGNSHLKAERFEEASGAYQQGLTAYANDRREDDTFYGLQHNLGVSLHRQQEFEQAQAAFDAALTRAPSDFERARAAYNAGNNAFQQQAAETALAHYRNALLANPDNEDAKFNYEFVSRWLEEQQQDQQQDDEEEQDQQEEDQQQNQENQQQDGEQDQEEQQPDEQQQQNQEQEQQQEPGEEEESQPQQQQPQESQLTREQAEQILEALENEEQQLLREIQKGQGQRRRVAKDW